MTTAAAVTEPTEPAEAGLIPGELGLADAVGQPESSPWRGPRVPYDIAREIVVAFLVVVLLTVVLAAVFSSPDKPAVTIQKWASADPSDFLATAVTELDGTSASGSYGPPYNAYTGSPPTQEIGPFSPERIVGVHIPVDSAVDFVLDPLRREAVTAPALRALLARWDSASTTQQDRWTKAYEGSVGNVRFVGAEPVLPPGDYGPVRPMMTALLGLARTGALDADLLSSHQFYGTDYTKPLLFISDGQYLGNLATAQHLSGGQWGMMNETGNYPGQAWLWLYTMWYQIPPFTTHWANNADAIIWLVMMVLSLVLLLVPFIPGLRDVPRLVPLYRLVWRDHYRRLEAPSVSHRS